MRSRASRRFSRSRQREDRVDREASRRRRAGGSRDANTPATVQEGMAGICAGSHAGEEHLALAEEVLRHLGDVVRVHEDAMDAVTAVSGSGRPTLRFSPRL